MGGAASSWMIDVLGKKMIDRDFKPAFAIKHQQKDLAIVLRTAREKGVPLPGVALVHQLLSALEAQGRGDEGTQALLTLYEQMSAPPVVTGPLLRHPRSARRPRGHGLPGRRLIQDAGEALAAARVARDPASLRHQHDEPAAIRGRARARRDGA